MTRVPKQVAWCQPCGSSFYKLRPFKKHVKECKKLAKHLAKVVKVDGVGR